MRMINIKSSLQDTPRPHYLVGSAELLLGESKASFSGSAIFPLSDPTIADRGDHVNVSHMLFAVWNAAHIIGGMANVKHFRVTKQIGKFYKEVLPGNTLQLSLQTNWSAVEEEHKQQVCERLGRNIEKLFRGKMEAVFTDHQDKEVAEFQCDFFGW